MPGLNRSGLRAGLLLLLAAAADVYVEISYSSVYSRLRGYSYQKRSAVTMVKRMLKKEIAVENDRLRLSASGRRSVEDWVPVIKYKKAHWDGKWRLIIYDVPEKYRKKRNQIREILNRHGYGLWQKSVYITPHPVMVEVARWLKTKQLFKYVVCLESKQVGGIDNRELAAMVFKNEARLEQWTKLSQRIMRQDMARELDEVLEKEPWLPLELEDKRITALKKKVIKLVGRKYDEI